MKDQEEKFSKFSVIMFYSLIAAFAFLILFNLIIDHL